MLWYFYARKKLVSQKEKQLDAKAVNTMKKYFGMVIGNGDAPVN